MLVKAVDLGSMALAEASVATWLGAISAYDDFETGQYWQRDCCLWPRRVVGKDMHPEVNSGEDGSRPIGAVVLVERWWRIGHGCRRV